MCVFVLEIIQAQENHLSAIPVPTGFFFLCVTSPTVSLASQQSFRAINVDCCWPALGEHVCVCVPTIVYALARQCFTHTFEHYLTCRECLRASKVAVTLLKRWLSWPNRPISFPLFLIFHFFPSCRLAWSHSQQHAHTRIHNKVKLYQIIKGLETLISNPKVSRRASGFIRRGGKIKNWLGG